MASSSASAVTVTRSVSRFVRSAKGVGVERIFTIESPFIEKITVEKFGKVRRAKLYYLRALTGKKARIKERRYVAEK